MRQSEGGGACLKKLHKLPFKRYYSTILNERPLQKTEGGGNLQIERIRITPLRLVVQEREVERELKVS